MKTSLESLKLCIEKLIELLECQGKIEIDTSLDPIRVIVTTKTDSRHLIGVQGQHLRALQHLCRSIVRKQLGEDVLFVLDINGYRAQHEESVRALAEQIARQATHSGRTIAMRPMSPSDRRLIHTALAERSDIRTESLGEEPNRRVIIRPVFL